MLRELLLGGGEQLPLGLYHKCMCSIVHTSILTDSSRLVSTFLSTAMVELRGEYNEMKKIKLNPIVEQYKIIYTYTYSHPRQPRDDIFCMRGRYLLIL